MRYRVSDLADLNIRSVSKNAKGVIYYIDTSSVFQGHFREANRYSAIADAPSRARRLAQEGDTVISMVRPSNEHIGFIDFDTDNYVFSTGFVVVHPNSEIVEPFYLYLLLSLDSTTRYLQQIAETSTTAYPSVKVEDIGNLSFDIPEISKQRKIVHKIRIIEQKIKLNQEINDNLLEISRQNYLKILSSKIAQHGRLSDLAEVTMGQSPKSDTYNFECNGLPLLNGAADFRGSISPSKWTSDPKRIAHKGEYIFGVRATVGLTRKIFRDYAIGRGTGAARARKEEFDEFLYFTLEELFNYYTHVGSGSVYVNISKNEFEEFKCMIPN
ncbi:hypothetical protein BTI66_08630, partial [Lactobacillus delbrueckii subsp. bulgaricus]|nr:hypothetical protein [Lactobacillus delbrueckii subsp. bulgaricus]